MNSYNERLDKALERLAVAGRGWGVSESVQIESMSSELDEAKQDITLLIKELVAEAKPEVKEVEKQIPGDMDSFLHNQEAIWSEQYVTEFEQNLLKALETQE